jgi:GAF domain-containing protein
VIGQVTETDNPVIAIAGARDTIHRQNPLLPDTVVEAAFPLHVGDRIIGALDVQSRESRAFTDANQIATLQALADSTALAIDNILQYEAQQERLKEREAMIEQTREAMHEVERLNEHLTGRAWSDYLRNRAAASGKDITLNGSTRSEDATEWTETLRSAARDGELVRAGDDDAQVVAVPLRVRGQVVGAMEFELDPGQQLSDEDLELLAEIGERFGLAAENARLIDESQRVAQREALVNQISGRFQSSNDIMRTLEEAAQGLQNALRAGSVAIRIGAPPEQS